MHEFNNLNKITNKIHNNYNYFLNKLNKKFYHKYINNNSAFLLIFTNKQIDLQKLKIFLEKKQIYLRYSFELVDTKDNFIRISAGTKSQYRKLIKMINLFLKG